MVKGYSAMPKLGFDDGLVAGASSFRICSPPVRPPLLRPWSAESDNGLTASGIKERGSRSLTIELGQASHERLDRLEAAVHDMVAKLSQVQEQQAGMTATLAELRDLLVSQRTIKDWYSPDEVAKILGKQPYTVREWCRYMRINARKRPTGRGDAKEWEDLPRGVGEDQEPRPDLPSRPNTESIACRCCPETGAGIVSASPRSGGPSTRR